MNRFFSRLLLQVACRSVLARDLRWPGSQVSPASRLLQAAAIALAALLPLRAADLPDLFAERVRSCVTVEFLVENELDRQPVTVLGVCVDANGTIILPASAIGARVSVRQFKDFKVYRPNSATAYHAEYLGQDVLTGWHFVRAEETLRAIPSEHLLPEDGKQASTAEC